MRIACYADTPLHVFNSVNLIWHDDSLRGQCDLFIHKQFSGYDGMLDALRRSGVFKNVYPCDLPIKRNEGRGYHALIRTVEIVFPGRFIDGWAKGVPTKGQYDLLLLPAPTRFGVALANVNPKAKIWFFEDGTVNYYGNIMDAYGPKYRRLFRVLFHKGHDTVRPEKMFVNNVELCYPSNEWEILPLPPLNADEGDFMALLGEIFGGSLRTGDRVTYLSMPVEEIRHGADVDVEALFKDTLTPLLPYCDTVVLRPHPREKGRDYYGVRADTHGALWELNCAVNVHDDSVLIGNCSTAQITPKILFGAEPYLIFLYRLYKPDPADCAIKGMGEMIDNLRSQYRRPEKVFDVATIEEYQRALDTIFHQQD